MKINNKFPFLNLLPTREVKRREQIFRTFKAKANAKRTSTEEFADWMTGKFGSLMFLGLNAIWLSAWILINTNLIPGIQAFDPFPFSLLTMIVSLEAIFLAIFVLISQNRAARSEDLREEVELQINIISEKEVTKLMKMLALLLQKQGIDMETDTEYKEMIKSISAQELQKKLEKEIQ